MMFFKYGSKEDLVPRPEGDPIRDPKSAKPSNDVNDMVPKKITFHAPPDKTASLQERLARVSEQFGTSSPKKDPLEVTTNNDSTKKDPLEISTNDNSKKEDPLEISNNDSKKTDNSTKKDPTLLQKTESIKVVFTPPASAKLPINVQQPIQKPNILAPANPIQKKPIVVPMAANPIQSKPIVVPMARNPIQNKPAAIVVPKPGNFLPLPKGLEHLGIATATKPTPENSNSDIQKNGIGNQDKIRMLEERMAKKESPPEVDNKNS